MEEWAATTRRLLRHCAKHARGEVLMTVRVPREQVLLSEFSDWHLAFNRALHIPQLPGETDDEWTRRWTSLHDSFDPRVANFSSLPISSWPSDLRAEIEDSWEAIFDPATWRTKPDLQATMHALRVEDVTCFDTWRSDPRLSRCSP